MKKFIIFVLSITLIPAVSFAYSGQAHVASFIAPGNNGYSIIVSNITDASIDVTISFYDLDGNLIQDGDDSKSAGVLRGDFIDNYDDDPTGASVNFSLLGHETGYAMWYPSSSKWGYAAIEWSQDSPAVRGLVASGQQNSLVEHHEINGGMPF